MEKIAGSLIQHGPFNDRVYLMKLATDDFEYLPSVIEGIAQENNYSKIFSKIPVSAKEYFLNRDHIEEALIPGFFNGDEDASFMAKYLSQARMQEPDSQENTSVLKAAISKFNVHKDVELSDDERFIVCREADTPEMADLYEQVFTTYPFPISDATYLLKTMSENFVYFGIRKNGKLVAVSSCEMDVSNSNVEMTDFATLPESQGKGYSYYLLGEMESNMRDTGIKTAYTIARAKSYGMNTVFSRHSYIYAGTLVNNTNISGGIESMNVWYKKL
ncbi:putative beta-lysine N-acetyltransferase [Methanolobus mangrovi]|uniref:Beta-lysine N-acetyltransferase n=1 Tax=Methanolobus mangrovi TaxID=3072977 RepID=A0AA51YIT3_9EURY|nr:putative beta-lysine N-acetyltransferase [Methanolobus mangrovi]WMW21873.1 putative beta-lysine N-acetyltransferase [Methanolobus mangrovi]